MTLDIMVTALVEHLLHIMMAIPFCIGAGWIGWKLGIAWHKELKK